jgi:GT2 family glycosyltransferase
VFLNKQSEAADAFGISVGIATYQRERILLDTIDHLLKLSIGATEIIVVDQTPEHDAATERELTLLESQGKFRRIRLPRPSITRAMNVVLEQARHAVLLFLDDDVVPSKNLVAAHARAHTIEGCNIVAGQVLQPGEEPLADQESEVGGRRSEARGRGAEVGGQRTEVRSQKSEPFQFRSSRRQFITELMGGNFSIKRELALKLGGFDENFVHVAYRFEAEFASRALAAGEKILFEPDASIRHLKASTGGTRAYGNHLTTIKPSHAVGEYYYLLRAKQIPRRLLKMVARPLRAVRTKHHLSHPWWIPGTLIAETCGFLWAVALAARGPRLIGQGSEVRRRQSEVGSQRSEVREQRS